MYEDKMDVIRADLESSYAVKVFTPYTHPSIHLCIHPSIHSHTQLRLWWRRNIRKVVKSLYNVHVGDHDCCLAANTFVWIKVKVFRWIFMSLTVILALNQRIPNQHRYYAKIWLSQSRRIRRMQRNTCSTTSFYFYLFENSVTACKVAETIV